MPIRWLDIDRYGHLNNGVHYLLMDTVINDWIGTATGVLPHDLPAIGLVAETGCSYLREVVPGDTLAVGLRLDRAGNSSISYQVGFFVDDGEPAAVTRFVHVYVDPETRRPTSLPDVLRSAAATITT